MAAPWMQLWCAPRDSDAPASGTSSHASRPPLSLVPPPDDDTSHHLQLGADLVDGLRARDESAYRELLAVAAPRLIAFAASIVQSADVAEDVVQQVIIRLWMRGETLNVPADALADYLFRAVRNSALTALRSDMRAIRARDALTREVAALGSANTAHDDEEWGMELARMRAALSQLTEHQRAAVALRYGEGLSIVRIAQILEISEKGAEQLLVRVRKILRERILREIVEP